MNPLLSIVVPTKDRYEYLKPLILLIQSFQSNKIEFVVQDNSDDNNEILTFIEELDFPNLKYYHTKGQISVAKNSDLAILNSTGKYVCFIGDDDGVSAHIVSAVEWMDENGIDAVKSAFCAYKWPSFSFSRFNDFSSTLTISYYNKSSYNLHPQRELIKFLKSGAVSFSQYRYLPRVYHGVVKRETLDKVYEIGGTFFPGASPDVANAVALSFVVNNFTYLNFPFIIPGNGNRTGGNIQKYKKLRAPIKDVPFLPENSESKWEKFIPEIWCGQTVFPESACKSLRYMDNDGMIEAYLNKEKMLAEFVLHHPDLFGMAFSKTKRNFALFFYILLSYFRKYTKGIYNKITYSIMSIQYFDSFHKCFMLNKRNYVKITKNIKDINEANRYLIEKEPNFSVSDTKIQKYKD